MAARAAAAGLAGWLGPNWLARIPGIIVNSMERHESRKLPGMVGHKEAPRDSVRRFARDNGERLRKSLDETTRFPGGLAPGPPPELEKGGLLILREPSKRKGLSG